MSGNNLRGPNWRAEESRANHQKQTGSVHIRLRMSSLVLSPNFRPTVSCLFIFIRWNLQSHGNKSPSQRTHIQFLWFHNITPNNFDNGPTICPGCTSCLPGNSLNRPKPNHVTPDINNCSVSGGYIIYKVFCMLMWLWCQVADLCLRSRARRTLALSSARIWSDIISVSTTRLAIPGRVFCSRSRRTAPKEQR